MWYNFLSKAIASRTNEPSIQWTLATCMFLPGMACAVAPRQILNLSLRKEKKKEINSLSVVIFQFFGMQACLVGTLVGTCRMTEQAYQTFAAAMVPFFGINFYYCFRQPIVAPLAMLADFVNNLVMSQLALAGATLLRGATKGTKKV
jgi:hypothetical protein